MTHLTTLGIAALSAAIAALAFILWLATRLA